MRVLLVALACLLLAAFSSAFGADVNGKWAATIDTQIGPLSWAWEFKADGPKLTGTATYDGKTVSLENGKIDGDSISFVENRELEGLGAIKIEYTGKIASAAEIKFKRQVGNIANEDFIAKRTE
jgi:hypothetical protein